MTEGVTAHDAELFVLGTIIQEPNRFYDIKNLRQFMFSSEPHKILYDIICELNSKGLVADINLLLSTLKTNNSIEQVGGESYLIYLKNEIKVPEANINEYVRQIISSYKRSALGILKDRISANIRSENPDDIISSTKDFLESLELTSGGEATQSIKDIMVDTVTRINDNLTHPGVTGISTGITGLDVMTGGLHGGDLYYIAGRPGQGKTAVACNEALHIGSQNNGVLFIEREMDSVTLAQRLIAIDTNISLINLITGRITPKELKLVTESIDRIKKYPIYVDTDFNSTFEYIVSTIKRYKKTRDIKAVFIDYIQLIAIRDEDQTKELGRMSRELKVLATSLNIPIIVLSQLNRLVELRDNKRPLMSDMRQCGNLEEDADKVIGLYRPCIYEERAKKSNALEHIILKHRNGPIGTVIMKFHEVSNRLED